MDFEQWIARLGCVPVVIAVYMLSPARAMLAVVAAIAVGYLYLAAFAWWQGRRTPINSASSPEAAAADALDDGGSERDGFFRNYFLPAFVH